MNRKRSIGAAIGLTALLITSAAAQPPTGPGDGAAPAVTVARGSLERVQNNWRGRTLIGTPVFDDHGQRIAAVNDLLITDDGKVDRVVLSVRGRRQLVAVPFGQLRFVPSRSFGTPLGRRGTARLALSGFRLFGVILPGASRDSLAEMETFRFISSP
jgi:hypothetical protein